jgi:uncharacterized protein (TIGR04562 family)
LNNGRLLKKEFTEFPYELFNVVLSKKSFVDIERLNVDTFEKAHSYVKNYGYDMDNPLHKDQVFAILNESKKFIQSYLLEDPDGICPNLAIPPEIQWEDDVRNILIFASEKEKGLIQRWACALLRVAHTITHAENDLSKYYFQGIKKQIFSRFMDHLNVNREGEYNLGRGRNQIKLKMFEMKSEKSKESLVMKLLHKSENVTADIFDRIGVRIVTNNKLDVIMVLKYLTENHVISFANIKPSRTRNNLINVKHFMDGIEELKGSESDNWSEDEIRTFLEGYLYFDDEKTKDETSKIIRENNPHSSTQYTSLQLTARQMINIQDPFNIQLSYKFFFPFEVQILDHDSYVESRTGRASHSEYKKSQLKAVRKRVLTNVINYYNKKVWNRDEQPGVNNE